MLHVTDAGAGPAILWIHGFPLASSMFEPQLAISGVRHLMPDLPGFGRSDAPPGQWAMDDYAAAMIDVLDQRGLERAFIAGFSMGGYIAFALARRALSRVQGLILIDTRETADDEKGRRDRYSTIEKVQAGGVGQLADSMLPKMLTDAAPAAMRARVREIMMAAPVEGVVAALRAMAERPDSSELLPSLKVPALVLVGEKDPITPPVDAERMAGTLPDARLVIIPDAAHMSNYEQANEVNRAVREFVPG